MNLDVWFATEYLRFEDALEVRVDLAGNDVDLAIGVKDHPSRLLQLTGRAAKRRAATYVRRPDLLDVFREKKQHSDVLLQSARRQPQRLCLPAGCGRTV